MNSITRHIRLASVAAFSNTDVGAESDRSRKAEHAYLDVDGNFLRQPENAEAFERNPSRAAGVYYKDTATGEEVSHRFELPKGVKVGHPVLQAACFGIRTLMTNTASAIRQAREKGETELSDVEGIKERLSELTEGVWSIPAGREGGPRYNNQTLAEAISAATNGARSVESALARIEAEPNYGPDSYKMPQVKAHYARIAADKRIANAKPANLTGL